MNLIDKTLLLTECLEIIKSYQKNVIDSRKRSCKFKTQLSVNTVLTPSKGIDVNSH